MRCWTIYLRMSTMFGLLIAAFLVVTTVNGESVAIGQYKQQLLDVHNAYRGMQGAADMHALVCTCMYSLDICLYHKNVKKVIPNLFY